MQGKAKGKKKEENSRSSSLQQQLQQSAVVKGAATAAAASVKATESRDSSKNSKRSNTNSNSSRRETFRNSSSRDRFRDSNSSRCSSVNVSAQQHDDMRKAFETLDREGKGSLDIHQFHAACRAFGIKGVNTEKVEALLLSLPRGRREGRERDVDAEEYTSVSFEQFTQMCLYTPASAAAAEEEQEIFTLLDRRAKGHVTAADLLHAARVVKSSLDAADVDLIIKETTKEGREEMTLEDLQRVFRAIQHSSAADAAALHSTGDSQAAAAAAVQGNLRSLAL